VVKPEKGPVRGCVARTLNVGPKSKIHAVMDGKFSSLAMVVTIRQLVGA
jgi:hypothetical protein